MTDVPTSDSASISDWAKKSSVSWIRTGSQTYPVWHEWVDDAICVVGSSGPGGSEQPLPPLTDGDHAVVLLRSKTDRQLVAAVPVVTSVVEPGSQLWDPVTAVLKAGRLNSPDMPDQVDRWARECRVLRLTPQGPFTPATDLPDEHPRTAPRLS